MHNQFRRTPIALLLVLGMLGVASCATPTSTGPTTSASESPSPQPSGSAAGPVAVPLPTDSSCDDTTTTTGAVTSLTLHVQKAGDFVWPIVDVCFGGKGPYPFIVDTGNQGQINVDTVLADQLGLEKAGDPLGGGGGVGCSVSLQEIRIGPWTMGGLNLPEDVAGYSTDIPGMGAADQPQGLIGSGLLARFGAVRFDFSQQRLVLATTIGPPLPEQGGDTATTPLPEPIVIGAPTITAPMTVSAAVAGNIAAVGLEVSPTFGSTASEGWLPDTGAPRTAIDAKLAADLGLKRTGEQDQQNSACATVTLDIVETGTWSLNGGTLPDVRAGTTDLTAIGPGLIGADVLASFGSTVFDYTGHRLILGAG